MKAFEHRPKTALGYGSNNNYCAATSPKQSTNGIAKTSTTGPFHSKLPTFNQKKKVDPPNPPSDDTASVSSTSSSSTLDSGRKEKKEKRDGTNVQVICRFRPQNQHEKAKGGSICVTFHEGECSLTIEADKKYDYTFDRVFDCDATQQRVFDVCGEPVIRDILMGYNATIFAYGQTSAGKTYTMMGPNIEDAPQQIIDGVNNGIGPDSQLGLAPRIVDGLFKAIEAIEESVEFTIKASYFEIYMERVHDLLSPEKQNLQVKEDVPSGKGFYVHDLTELYVASPDEIFELMKIGNLNRKTSSTSMNRESSRSHSIFLLSIFQNDTAKKEQKSTKLCLVDLAGSEKVSKTNAEGKQLEEAKAINQSLTALGKVIYALTDKKSTHIPYRDSKLTKLLQDSLGGNSRTTLLINCSPSSWNAEETLSTLRFGTRSKKIKNKPHINKEFTVQELQVLLSRAKDEIQDLRIRNATLETELETLRLELASERKINDEHKEAANQQHLQASHATIAANNLILAQELEKKKEEVQQKEEEIISLNLDMEAMRLREKELEEENAQLSSMVKDNAISYKRIQQENEELRKELALTKAILSAAQQQQQQQEEEERRQRHRDAIASGSPHDSNSGVFFEPAQEIQYLKEQIALLTRENEKLKTESIQQQQQQIQQTPTKPASRPGSLTSADAKSWKRSLKFVVPLRGGGKQKSSMDLTSATGSPLSALSSQATSILFNNNSNNK